MDFIENLSTLSTVPVKSLQMLGKYLDCVHSHELITQKFDAKDNIYELKTFEGSIFIQIVDDYAQYKFVPNQKFTETVVAALVHKKDLLVDGLAEKLAKSLSAAYKDVL